MSFLLFWGPEQVNRGSTRVCRHVVHVEMLLEGLTTGMYPPHCLFQTLPTANSRSHDNNQNWCKQIIVKFPSWSLCVLTSHISTSLQSSLQSTRSALTMTSKMTPRCRNARQRQSVNVITVFGFIFSLFKVSIFFCLKWLLIAKNYFLDWRTKIHKDHWHPLITMYHQLISRKCGARVHVYIFKKIISYIFILNWSPS